MISMHLNKEIHEYVTKNAVDIRHIMKQYTVKMLGPELTDDGDEVTGYQGSVENMQFQHASNQEQKDFFYYLMEKDITLAMEYAFYVIKAIDYWKHKIEVLKVIKSSLTKEERLLLREIRSLNRNAQTNPSVAHVLKEHLPKVYELIVLTNGDLQKNITHIAEVYKKVHGEEDMIDNAIKAIYNQFPFLK